MQLPDERLDLLMACIKRGIDAAEVTRLRGLLMSDPGSVDGLLRAASRRLATAALIDALEEKGIIHPAIASVGAGKPATLRTAFGTMRRQERERRRLQGSALRDIIGALNAAGIVPLIIKGAVSLLTGEPSWRFQRDLDFAIDPAEAEPTMAILRRLDFQSIKTMSSRHHHLDAMARGDPPVIVEPHLRINGPRAARFFASVPMVESAVHTEFDGLAVRLLRPEHALLHGLVHHHFENRGNHFGVIAIKGLLEFAHMLDELCDETFAEVAAILRCNPRLRAATELWIAASDVWLGVSPPHGLRPRDAAYRRLSRVTARLTGQNPASIGSAMREEIAGIADAVVSGGPSSWLRAGAVLIPVFDCLHNRPWGGRPRTLKSAGLLVMD
ncbi:MAG: nucleotidyltransferase family protein [Hyphomonas sp.]|nr:nucleotidyltransferase family protein [Hyphomonas sp.]